MHLTFLTKYFPPDSIGGGEISAYHLGKALKKRGHEVTVIKRGREDKEVGYEGLLIREVKDLFQKAVPTFEQPWARVQAKILQKKALTKTDLIHAHDFQAILVTAALKEKYPKIKAMATVRDYWPVCGYGKVKLDGRVCPGCIHWSDFRDCPKVQRGNFFRKRIRILRYHHNIPLRQKALTTLDKIVYISRALKAEIERSRNFAMKKEGYIISNPLPLDWCNLKFCDRSPGKNILYAGLLDLHKGFGVLLHALKRVLTQSDFHLVVAGTGPLLGYYQKLAQRLGLLDKGSQKRIEFLGFVPYARMKNLYRNSDLVLAPSLWPEPFGRTLIEGMCLGKAVIGTKHGAHPEIIKPKQTGLLVPPGDPHALAQSILLLLRNPELAKKLGQAACHDVIQNFHPDKIAKQYEMVYQEMF